MNSTQEMYYIICKRHGYRQDHAMLFWGPDNSGYYYDLNKAGKYTAEQAKTFVHPTDDAPVLCSVIDGLSTVVVVDNKGLGRIAPNTKQNRALVGTKVTELHAGSTAWDNRAFCTVDEFKRQTKNVLKILEDIKEYEREQDLLGYGRFVHAL